MLVLSRKRNERIMLDGNIVITVVGIGWGQVRIGIDAPAEITILREEVAQRLENGEPRKDQA